MLTYQQQIPFHCRKDGSSVTTAYQKLCLGDVSSKARWDMKSGSPREQRPSLLMGETRLPFLGKVLVMPMGLLGEGTLALCPCLMRAQMVFPSCLLEVWKKFVCSRFWVRLWGKGILCTSLPGADLGGGRKQGSTWVFSRTRWFILTWRMMSISGSHWAITLHTVLTHLTEMGTLDRLPQDLATVALPLVSMTPQCTIEWSLFRPGSVLPGCEALPHCHP